MDSPPLMEQAELESGRSSKTPGSEPIPGYRLIALLGKGGFGEAWKCEAPGGLFKAIKFVYGNMQGLEGASAEEELRAIQHVKAIRHPFLLSIERVEVIDGELLIVTELADKSLHDVFAAYRQAGASGIPREELLGYLREAAEALDLLNIQYGLQHLDIKPQNLFLVSGHVKIADFGLVSSLAGRSGEPAVSLSAITPVYAPPEIFRDSLSAHCDQYSLAIVYQELLTGRRPFRGNNLRQLLLQHTTAEPNLDALPEPDRLVVAKALAKEPNARFATCTDFVLALATSDLEAGSSGQGAAAARGSPRAGPKSSLKGDSACGLAGGATRSERLLPGYRFVEYIGCTPQAEIWKAIAPGEKTRQVKYLFGLNSTDKHREAEALDWLNAIRYPTLAYLEILQQGSGRLLVVTDWAEKSLWKRFQQSQGQGGIPRAELLGHLRTAAETLDRLYEQHAIQHLGLNPRNLLLEGDALMIEGFGLMQLLFLPAGQPIPQAQKSYSAPELLRGNLSRACDQYSLALIYFDLVCGTGHRRPQAKPMLVAKRDLGCLPESERPIVARALREDPQQRWSIATEFIKALQEANTVTGIRQTPKPLANLMSGKPVAAGSSIQAGEASSTDRIISGLATADGNSVSTAAAVDNEEVASEGEILLRKFSAPLPLGTARQKLEEFAQQCGAHVIREDEEHLVLQVIRPRSFWQQCLGRQPGLELRIHLGRPRTSAATPIEVTLQIASFGCRRKHGAQLLKELGSLLLESVRTCLQVNPERRLEERLVWQQTLPVRCILPDGALGEVVDCKGKDISANGIGFYLPRPLPTTLVSIDVPTDSQPSTITVRANIVRVQRCGNGWYEVGALFLKSDDRPSAA